MSNPIDIPAVRNAAEKLEKARDALAQAQKNYEAVKGLCGQKGYAVSVNGVRVDVAVMDSQTYQAKLIRGREMIHLGAQKALQAQIDAWVRYVAHLEFELRALVATEDAH
ncbi:hypothetical protein XacyCFBP2565_08610 [Xanthomonas arboricola pv. corylina]|uniref:hypothetical protein n=1 Tax=Xanthomonas arboricola TaxID=56448 RepID=UPI000CEE5230|nr:hypothetical protein [Xanthomonas arboricola]PPU15846.1 hypothetical protein XacyCFBP2565_08610 [Xanthomonas arboricola pv. corylina]